MKTLHKKYKILIITFAIILSAFLYYEISTAFLNMPISSIKQYKFYINKLELVSEIQRFKELNPKFKPIVNDSAFSNETFDPNDVFSPIFFYFPDMKYMVRTYLEGDKNSSCLGFYMVIDLQNNRADRYKEINVSLSSTENKKLKKLFEERIVNPLHKQIREKYKHYKKKK